MDFRTGNSRGGYNYNYHDSKLICICNFILGEDKELANLETLFEKSSPGVRLQEVKSLFSQKIGGLEVSVN